MSGNVIISEADSPMHQTKQGRKAHALWGISWCHLMCNTTAEVSSKPRSLKQVQLYTSKVT